MQHFKETIIVITALLATSLSREVKPITVARTELKVSRSLDPSTMQTVNVVTKDGSVAQLIVKRRDGKSQSTTTTAAPTYQSVSESKLMDDTIQSSWVPLSSSLSIEPETFSQRDKQIGNQIANDDDSKYRKVPKPVTIRSDNVFVKSQPDDAKKGRSIIQLGSDGIPVVHGVRVPDDETDTKVWRNARVINGELVPYEKGYVPKPAIPVGQLVYASKVAETKDDVNSFGPFTTADNFALLNRASSSIGPFTIHDNRHQESFSQGDYIGNKNNYVRFNPESGIGPFTKVDNTRTGNSKLIDYIKQINEQEMRRDYFTSRKYRSTEQDSSDNPQMQRRMLQYGGTHNYPNSLLYTPTSTKMSRVNFNDGVRTPVLQYAHPELGVQPAKVPSEENDNMQYASDRNAASFTQDTYSERPYESSTGLNDYTDSGRNSHNKYYENGNYYTKETSSYHPYGQGYYRIKTPEQPFWMKLTTSIKDNLQHGIARMQQFTRPVLDPIVEATQKIGHNLGLTHMPPSASAQEKVGLIGAPVIGTSVFLPALGLVAGGAALGLGAAAVGRFLDVGSMRSQDGSYINDLDMQHKRALDTYGNNQDIIVVMETSGNDNGSQGKSARQSVDESSGVARRKRSSTAAAEDDKYLEQLVQSVEHDVSSATLGAHLAGSDKWADTPCAKRMFCDVMVRQPYEQVAFMEKKMDSFLSIVHPVLVNSVSHHLQEVMSAVKRHDCSQFLCPTAHAPRK